MRQVRWASWTVAVAAVVLSGAVRVVHADITSDQAAGIVVWPIVNVTQGAAVVPLVPFAGDTIIQLSNTGTNPVEAHCFYLNANNHCTNTGNICNVGAECCGTTGCGFCLPNWQETDFNIFITTRQPIAWEASDGLASGSCNGNGGTGEQNCVALDGVVFKGPLIDPHDPTKGNQSNAGTNVPPVPEVPFIGELKCIAVDATGAPLTGAGANVLKGEAILENATAARLDVGKYNAIGIKALADPVDDGDPKKLTLFNDPNNTGAPKEYEGCPAVLILNHFFDFGLNPAMPVATPRSIFTWPVFVPCTEDLLKQVPGVAVAQYLVFNEFEQRFSTSNTVQCFRATRLSLIDTTQPANSIFNVGVSGTLVGQTRVTPIGSGLLAVALEFHTADATGATALTTGQEGDFNVHYQGQRAAADVITIP